MNRVLFSMLLALVLTVGGAQAAVEDPIEEISGQVQQWAPDGSTIRVGGVIYRLTADHQVVDRQGRAVRPAALSAGQRVMLKRSRDEVFEIVVDEAGSGASR